VAGTSGTCTLWKAAASAVMDPEKAYIEIYDGSYGIMNQIGKTPFGCPDPWRIVFMLPEKYFLPCDFEGYKCKHREAKDKVWCGCCTEVRVISDRFLVSMVYH